MFEILDEMLLLFFLKKKLNHCLVVKEDEMKVHNFMIQDDKAGRTYLKKNYVDVEWIRDKNEEQGNMCCLCRCAFEVTLNDGGVTSNITVDRVNNSLAHLKDNCQLTCHN